MVKIHAKHLYEQWWNLLFQKYKQDKLTPFNSSVSQYDSIRYS